MSRPTIEAYTPKTLYRDWGEEIFIAETPHYLGKLLKMKAGTKGGLQYHVEKDETFHLVTGQALVRYTRPTGMIDHPDLLCECKMHMGDSFHIPPGAVHQVEAVTDCVLFEASTPHYDDRVRVEQEYGLPEAGGLPTTSAPFTHVAFGLRRDGTIGRAELGNPVAESVQLGLREDGQSIANWSDGTTGPIRKT